MFDKLRRARADLSTMNTLFPAAERIAAGEGVDRPGAEHLLLAAFELEDGIGVEAFKTYNVTPDDLRTAIAAQHQDALLSVGVDADDEAIAAAMPAVRSSTGPYQSQGSMQTAFQRSMALAKADKAAINSGHLLLAVTEPDHGIVSRALDRLGVTKASLQQRTRQLLSNRA